MIPPEYLEQLRALSLFEVALVGLFLISTGWVVIKFARWLIRRFFPGMVAGAKAVLNGAEILAAVKDLPEFIERTDAAVKDIHHEVHFNNGSSVKDAVTRIESAVLAVQADVGELRNADQAIRDELGRTPPPETP